MSGIQLIANGDINTEQDVAHLFGLGVDGVMIGRGAIHSPWIFRHIKHYLATGEILGDPPIEERVQMCMRHLADSAAYRGERRGVLSFRRHYAGYLRGEHSIAHLRKDLMQLETVAGVHERLLRYLDERQAPVAV